MTIRATGGFGYPWIEWDGRIGEREAAGTVLLDGHPVPVYATECGYVSHTDHTDLDDYCSSPVVPGARGQIAWHAPLENGAWVYASADDEHSNLMLFPGYEGDPRPPLRLYVDTDGTEYLSFDPACRGIECVGCVHDPLDAGHIYADFESRGEYLNLIRRYGVLPVRLPEPQEAP